MQQQQAQLLRPEPALPPTMMGEPTAAPAKPTATAKPTKTTEKSISQETEWTAKEFSAAAREIAQLDKDHAVKIGKLLAVASEHAKQAGKGKWEQFCQDARITRRMANLYIAVATSPHARKLQGIGIAKASVLLRHLESKKQDEAKKAADLLASGTVGGLSVKELTHRLRGEAKKSGRGSAADITKQIEEAEAAADEVGYARGLTMANDLCWAVGMLRMQHEDRNEPDFRARAFAKYEAERPTCDTETQAMLDDAIEIIKSVVVPVKKEAANG